MPNIEDINWGYKLLHFVVKPLYRCSLRRVEYRGVERLPKDGAIIYVPNHTNALMDPLAVLYMDQQHKVFVARADMFNIKPLATILNFVKIMPVMRVRDGLDQVRKNGKTMDRAVEVLRHKVPFCIFAEGCHKSEHTILPLTKGVFRIALQAQAQMSDDCPLYIVPIGVTFSNCYRFRSNLFVDVGQPLRVDKYKGAEDPQLYPQVLNQMKEDCTREMRKTIFYIPKDQNYEAVEEICAANIKQQLGSKRAKLSEISDFNNCTTQRIQQLIESNPDKAEKLLKTARELRAERLKRGISQKSLATQPSVARAIAECALALIISPLTIVMGALRLPIELIYRALRLKVKDRIFGNTFRFALNLLVWPLLVAGYCTAAELCTPLHWWEGLLITAPSIVLGAECYRFTRIAISNLKFATNKRLKTLITLITNQL